MVNRSGIATPCIASARLFQALTPCPRDFGSHPGWPDGFPAFRRLGKTHRVIPDYKRLILRLLKICPICGVMQLVALCLLDKPCGMPQEFCQPFESSDIHQWLLQDPTEWILQAKGDAQRLPDDREIVTVLDVPVLLAAVSPDSPCGDDLEYDAAFLELERIAQGQPERQMGDAGCPPNRRSGRAYARWPANCSAVARTCG